MTTESKIDYESLTQEAMRGVVRAVLNQIVEDGLPGEHHFYISFDTTASGVSVSKRLKAKYPQEMTIVLQHRFWDLMVLDDRFEVKLTFDGIPERLVVPYQAIKVFFDPSVRYGLQFEETGFNSESIEESMEDPDFLSGADDNDADADIASLETPDADGTLTDEAPDSAKPAIGKRAVGENQSAEDDDEDSPASGAEIVSLDAFRKK